MDTVYKATHLVEGPITPDFIRKLIAEQDSSKNAGAHCLFIGQVRGDLRDGKSVRSIEYSCYAEMADEIIGRIRKDAVSTFDLVSVHVHHSIGTVEAGGVSLLVLTSSVHRKNAFDACGVVVDKIKSEVPVWGKEVFDDDSVEWKINK